ncbi:MAG: hypothetical protein IJY23_03265 [Clostridia bacterium]|nr:hypothetical protein [Clostridia bacterium]
MFKITPVQDRELAKAYLDACSAVLLEDTFIYAMTDCESGNIMGISQFEIMGDCGYIYDIKEADGLSDFEAMFILGRQTMNFINSCGMDICRASKEAADESLIKAIGFKLNGNSYECNTEGMFDGSHCSGH